MNIDSVAPEIYSNYGLGAATGTGLDRWLISGWVTEKPHFFLEALFGIMHRFKLLSEAVVFLPIFLYNLA